jgi:hypothetical protein
MLLPDCEKLLHLISIQGELGISKFHDFFEQIYPASLEPSEDKRYFARFQAIRFLEALGHCEHDYENRRLYVCPPLIALQSEWGIPHAILTGARIPSFMIKLRDFTSHNKRNLALREISQPCFPMLPMAIILKATSKEIIEQAAAYAGIDCELKFPVPSTLLESSDGVKQIYEKLKFDQTTGLNWQKLTFSTQTLGFTSNDYPESNTKLVEYTNKINRRKVHFLWVDGQAAEVDRDWGRFIVLFLENTNVILYSKKRFQLFLPASTPLPAIVARAITLKSGVIPIEKKIDQKNYWVYGGIDPIFAAQVARKLGQTLNKI